MKMIVLMLLFMNAINAVRFSSVLECLLRAGLWIDHDLMEISLICVVVLKSWQSLA